MLLRSKASCLSTTASQPSTAACTGAAATLRVVSRTDNTPSGKLVNAPAKTQGPSSDGERRARTTEAPIQ